VVQSIQEFFQGGVLPNNINSNMIVLIPKVPGAKSMGDYRPIALANFKFKIVTIIVVLLGSFLLNKGVLSEIATSLIVLSLPPKRSILLTKISMVGILLSKSTYPRLLTI